LPDKQNEIDDMTAEKNDATELTRQLSLLRRQVSKLETEIDSLRNNAKNYSLVDDVDTPITNLTAEGEIIMINSAGAAGFGGEPKDFIGKSVLKILPDVADISRARLQHIVKTGTGRSYEDKINLPTGDCRWYRSNFRPIRKADGEITAINVISYDITEQKNAEEQLHLLSSIVRQSAEGIALADLDGNLQYVNNAFAEMHGYTPEELIGKNLTIFHTPEQLLTVHEANKQLRNTGEFVGEIWHLRRDGTIFPTMMHNSLLRDDSGQPTALIGILNDISHQKRIENVLRKTSEELKSERNALREKNIAMKQILEHISIQKQDALDKIQSDMERTFLPPLKRLKKKLGRKHVEEIENLEKVLKMILPNDGSNFGQLYNRLSVRELEICNLIKGGLSSKQISESLNLSILTIFKHREQIRKKLELTNKEIGLAAYLRSHQ
jgi:PAS domain S-box-containing protein